MNETATEQTFTVRCDDCGHITALPREGGPIDDCCDLDDLRRISIRRSDGEWISYPNYQRDTVDGPPRLIWQPDAGAERYGLYVDGKLVDEISGAALAGEKPIALINRFLAAAYKP